eukprot:g5764.t1
MNEVTEFLDACPRCPENDEDSSVDLLIQSVSKLKPLIENNADFRTPEFQKLVEFCLYDMIADGETVEKFVEFGLWILDHCIVQEHTNFFETLDRIKISEFLNKERFRYSIVRKRNSTALIRSQEYTFCAKEWCSREGLLLCSRCLHGANRRVAYCSRACQLSHWATHRRLCGRNIDTSEETYEVMQVADSTTQGSVSCSNN